MSEKFQVFSYYNDKKIIPYFHSSIVIFDTEYSYGEDGVSCTPPGNPSSYQDGGTTNVTKIQLEMFIIALTSKYNKETYNALTNNCFHFAVEVARFLNINAKFPENLQYQECLRQLAVQAIPLAVISGSAVASASSSFTFSSTKKSSE